jgi:hypothetical protein
VILVCILALLILFPWVFWTILRTTLSLLRYIIIIGLISAIMNGPWFYKKFGWSPLMIVLNKDTIESIYGKREERDSLSKT